MKSEVLAKQLSQKKPSGSIACKIIHISGACGKYCPSSLRQIDLEGESQRDYAEKAGLSYSTLKSRVQKGRTKLRKLFDDCCQLNINQRGEIVE